MSQDHIDDDRGLDREEEDARPEGRRRPRQDRGVVLFADRGGSIIRTGDSALDEDMPVLNAFRQFLDQERRRARRQMIGISALFTFLFIALVGVGGWYVRQKLHGLEEGVAVDLMRQEEARLETVSNLQAVARSAVSLKKDVIDTRQASAVLRDKVREQSDELTKLLDTITALEIQNSMLQRTVKIIDRDINEKREPVGPLEYAQPPVVVAGMPAGEPVVVSQSPARQPLEPVMNKPREPESERGDVTLGGIPFRLPLPKDQ